MKKKSTNIFAIIVGLLMVFAFMPLNMGQAYAETKTIVDGVEYALNDDEMTATVTGCDDDQSEITIPVTVGDNQQYTVKSIAYGAFFYHSGLTKVEFAEGSQLESIGAAAFYSCYELQSITIPDSVTSIGGSAFLECWKLESFTIPAGVTTIAQELFSRYTHLKSITIPSGVRYIENGAFFECPLTSINFLGASDQWDGVLGEGKPEIEGAQEISFMGDNGFLQYSLVKTGEIPSYHGPTPTKEGDEQHDAYVFAGWDSEITAATCQMSYYATFVPAYTIKFVDEDGTILQSDEVPEGTTPEYTGETPTKAADEQYIYTFAGWDPEITEAKGDATYTAKYSKTERISLKGAKVVLSAKAFTYNGKVRKPTIKTIGGKKLTAGTDYEAAWANSKNVGSYTVTVTGKGKYTGAAKATYKINPKGTSITSTKGAKKAFTVKWKKQPEKMSKSRITGYQVRYSTKSSMKGAKTVTVKGYAKTSAKITKLKKKTKYYVQVRTFKTISSANYYSGWSKKSTVKTK